MKTKQIKPDISVIMSVYNQRKYLKKAVLSILKQTFSNFEFLVIDDASIDNSKKILKEFNDKRLKLFFNKKRKGLSKNLNFLIKKSKAKYIARMDGDDIALLNRFKEQKQALDRNPNIMLLGSWVKIINSEDKEIGEFKHPTKYKQTKNSILAFNPFIHPSIMVRKKLFNKVGLYDENLFYSQDYDLFLRIAAKYRCINIPKFLLKFRWDPDFDKQKLQHKTALDVRLKAVKKYGYSKTEITKLLKPLIFYYIPTYIKKFYWRFKLKI